MFKSINYDIRMNSNGESSSYLSLQLPTVVDTVNIKKTQRMCVRACCVRVRVVTRSYTHDYALSRVCVCVRAFECVCVFICILTHTRARTHTL